MEPQFAEYQALFEVSESIALHRDLTALFHDLLHRLPRIVSFDCLWLVLHNPDRNTMRLHILAADTPAAIDIVDRPIEESPSGLVWQTQQPLVVDNAEVETRYPTPIAVLRNLSVKSFCIVPLTTAHRRVGAMGFGSSRLAAYKQADLNFIGLVARQVALAVDNTLSHQEAQSFQRELSRERDRLRLLLDLNNSVMTNLDLRDLLRAVSTNVRRVMQCDYASVALPEASGTQLRVYGRAFSSTEGSHPEEIVVPVEGSPSGQVHRSGQALSLNSSGLARFDPKINPFLLTGLKSACFIPLLSRSRVIGTLNVAMNHEDAFDQADQDFLRQVATQVAIAIENALDYREISKAREQLTEEKLYLTEEIQIERDFEEIVGESDSLKSVLDHVKTVAPTDSTVLILGETGTGKEMIARAIHGISSRRERTFVKVNCAAIPLGLLESELFGHEKGAFTGAIARKIGRFELADGGTLFLDEVGDIPLELQPKLLRILQEQEFERLGSTTTRRVSVRLIAATSQDLPAMIQERTFRSDLYYRLHIFPITVPPLRERPSDIRILAQYFAEKYARRMNKRIEAIPVETIDVLTNYSWPGNVRELQNFIERAVILTRSKTLEAPLAELRKPGQKTASHSRTLVESEREQILEVLAETNGVLGGPGGAAERLGLKRTTLFYKMRRLGIPRHDPRQSTDSTSKD